MNLSAKQHEWLDKTRREWYELFRPFASHDADHLFGTIPAIRPEAIQGAVMFGTREDGFQSLPLTGRVIAEIGTQAGYFAANILGKCDPAELHIFDLEFDTLKAHRCWITEDARVRLHPGDSSSKLEDLPDQFFDCIYVDGDHSREGVTRDVGVAVRKLKNEGTLVFNDYTLWSVLELTDYGIIPVVNQLLASGEWKIRYFTLHPLMYCDVAICRVS